MMAGMLSTSAWAWAWRLPITNNSNAEVELLHSFQTLRTDLSHLLEDVQAVIERRLPRELPRKGVGVEGNPDLQLTVSKRRPAPGRSSARCR